jgi:hypothetical protein
MFARESSTVVEHSPHHQKAEGLSPALADNNKDLKVELIII